MVHPSTILFTMSFMNFRGKKYLIVLEKGKTGYSAYSPDVLGCIATGKTSEKTISNMKSALKFHLQGTIEDGEEIPQPQGVKSYFEAANSSAGEEYIMIHISVAVVLPEAA
jgi:predicted RNase H-like HicB family nuclease